MDLNDFMLNKTGERVNSAGHLIDADGALIEGAEDSTVHSNYKIGQFSGERSIEMAFHVQHVLQAHIVTAQGSMADMLDPDDRDAIQKSESMDESMQSKYGGQIRRIQGDVLSNLKPDEMFKLVKMLFEQVIINGENGVKALGSHFAKNKSHILPVLKEVIRVNDFLDLDMTAPL